jgi:AraC family transcriptional regulator of adaptative response / DNA-3-methyladenine glycosylase II
VRRFNDAFVNRYRMPPSRLRKKATDSADAIVASETSVLQLTYRPPYDWNGILAFLAARALTGIEHVTDDSYARTVRLGKAKGWIRVTHAAKRRALLVEFTHTLTPVLPALLARVRALFDLDARPDVIAKRLAKDPRLTRAIKANPGLRVPGAFNGFEMGLRAILGQQVTVRAATTIAGRFVAAFGEPIVMPVPELTRLTPLASRVAKASIDDIARHGILASRSKSIIALARAHESGELRLDGAAHHNPADSIRRLAELPGIGPWTAHYLAMRAMRWPDAFPKEDIAVRNTLGGVSAKEAEALSQPWRPWRSYAVMHLWGMSGQPSPATPA